MNNHGSTKKWGHINGENLQLIKWWSTLQHDKIILNQEGSEDKAVVGFTVKLHIHSQI